MKPTTRLMFLSLSLIIRILSRVTRDDALREECAEMVRKILKEVNKSA
jgi:hypothetical protein